jgi:hypothetical protein
LGGGKQHSKKWKKGSIDDDLGGDAEDEKMPCTENLVFARLGIKYSGPHGSICQTQAVLLFLYTNPVTRWPDSREPYLNITSLLHPNLMRLLIHGRGSEVM